MNHMKNKTWVMDFIFTHCSGPCLLVSENFDVGNRDNPVVYSTQFVLGDSSRTIRRHFPAIKKYGMKKSEKEIRFLSQESYSFNECSS